MRTFARTAIAVAALGLLAAPTVQAQERQPARGEVKLAEMLEGRVAGEAESCINTLVNRNLKLIDETAIVYKQGDTLWVNTTSDPRSIDDDDILVIDRFSPSRLCRTDQITLRDRGSGFFSGVIILGDFVPYRKVAG